jgi:hypothetical protein
MAFVLVGAKVIYNSNMDGSDMNASDGKKVCDIYIFFFVIFFFF